VVICFLFKFTIAPFNAWVGDVFEAMPPFVAPFILILPKFSILCINYRLLYFIEPFNELIPSVLDTCESLSILVGGIAGMFELNFLRIAAFSSIVNIGMLLLPLLEGDFVGFHMSLLFFIVYFILLFNLFSCVFAFRFKRSLLVENLIDLKFISNMYPLLAFLFVIAIFSFVGIPPLAGFFPKFFVIYNLMERGSFFIALFVIFSSSISAFFYMDFIFSIYFRFEEAFAPGDKVSILSFGLILVSSFLNIFFILYFPILNYWIDMSLLDLYDSWLF